MIMNLISRFSNECYLRSKPTFDIVDFFTQGFGDLIRSWVIYGIYHNKGVSTLNVNPFHGRKFRNV